MIAKINRPAAWKALLLLLLALILARFLIVGLPKILNNSISSDGDESAYLALGLALTETGTLSDGTRPPLYALLLNPWAERDWSYFTTAKLVTLAVGVLTVLATFIVGVRLFGWEAALLAAFLLAANKEFHVRASTVYADTLLALVMLGSWYYLIKSLEGWKYCVLAGIFVGLAFLTKGSAPVLLAAWGLTALLVLRRTIIRRPALLLVPLFFVITSLPLLVYNAREFGSPTYNFATQHIMWMDRLAQIDTADPSDLPTFSSYVATHTPEDVLARVQRGLRRLNPVVETSLIPSREFEPAWLGPLLAGLALAGLLYLLFFQRDVLWAYLRRRQAVLWFTFFLGSLFYVFFTWYVAGSSAETRFIVPLLAPLYLVLADMVVSLIEGLGRRVGSLGVRPARSGLIKGGYRLVITLALAWAAWWLIDTGRRESWALSIDPYEADRQANAEVEAVVQWLAADRPVENALILFGPSKSVPLWKLPARFTVERLPLEVDTWPAMQAQVQARRPDYIIIDHDTVRRRRQALADHFQRFDDGELVMFEQLPPAWALDFVYPGRPCKWCIFSPVEEVAPLARLSGGITLLGYRVAGSQAQSDPEVLVSTAPAISLPAGTRSLRLTLTWQAQIPLEEEYTVFVHLTAPDGFVKAQADRPPFEGAYPTSQWQPGETLADRYDLELNESVTPGDYLLLAGMYRPASGERLSLVDGPAGPVPGAILLGSVHLE